MQRYALWLIPVLLLTTALTTPHLNDDAFWADELFSYVRIGKEYPPAPHDCPRQAAEHHSVVTNLCVSAILASWPPGYYLLLQGWVHFAGTGHYSGRVLSLFLGWLAICTIFRLGSLLFNKRTGFQAATLCATSAMFIFYQHEMRAYTLYLLLCTLCAWLYWLILKQPDRLSDRYWRWSLSLSIALALYTHYLSMAFVAAIGLYHLIVARPNNPQSTLTKEHWQQITRLSINGILLFSPWIGVAILGAAGESTTSRSIATLTLLEELIYGFSNNLALLSLPLLLFSLYNWRDNRIRFLWLWLIGTFAGSLLANLALDFLFHPRHLLALLPPFVLLIAFSLQKVDHFITKQHIISWGFMGVWVLAGLVATRSDDFMAALSRHVPAVPLVELETMQNTIEQCAADDDLLLFSFDEPGLQWLQDWTVEFYFARLHPREQLIQAEATLIDHTFSILIPADLQQMDYAERFRILTENTPQLWLFVLSDTLNAESMERIDMLTQEAGYLRCDPIIEEENLLTLLYTRENISQCQQVIQSCGGD